MSAILRPESAAAEWSLEPMSAGDLETVESIERSVYSFPWTLGNFKDSLNSGYRCVVCRAGGIFSGYAVQMYAIDEAHLLNITIAPAMQRGGIGSRLLQSLMDEARERRMSALYLEVRPSNNGAQSLYSRFGFSQVSVRRDYYPAHAGREDALVLKALL